MMQFQKATKKQAKLRLGLIGMSGSGKTYSSLKIAAHLGGRVALIDTERGSASKYAGLFEFDTLELDTFSPQTYIEAIRAAGAAGYDILIIDSLSHAWFGKGGALEMVDNAAKRSQSHNSYVAWREVTPLHNQLIDAILQVPCHVIATMRAKSEYVMDKDERTGKTMPRKVGLAPIQRDGMEYEFDVVADMTAELDMVVSKSRCPALTGAVINKPGKEVADTLKAWLTDGAPEPQSPKQEQPEPTQPTHWSADAAVMERMRAKLAEYKVSEAQALQWMGVTAWADFGDTAKVAWAIIAKHYNARLQAAQAQQKAPHWMDGKAQRQMYEEQAARLSLSTEEQAEALGKPTPWDYEGTLEAALDALTAYAAAHGYVDMEPQP